MRFRWASLRPHHADRCLTPCPVSNIATHNLVTSSLEDGLRSSLFEEIRNNDHLLEIEGVPCALFAHPKEVEDLVKNVGAYRTNHEYQSSKMKEYQMKE